MSDPTDPRPTPPRTETPSPLVRYGLAALPVAALAVLARLGLSALGRASQTALESGQLGPAALDIALFGGSIALAVLAVRLAAWKKIRAKNALPALTLTAVVFAVGWWGTLRHSIFHVFHGVLTNSASQSWTDSRPNLPHITYRHDSSGFRGAGFDVVKSPSRRRIALVGDSFIYGLGVEENQTLKARLEEELSRRGLADRVEVLNLGIPGSNLATHVRMYGVAREHLGADAVVMGVFEDNDLSTWDIEDELVALDRPSLFSLGSFLLGERPSVVIATAFAQLRGCASARAAFDRIAPDLAAQRARDGAPPLVILDYFTHHPEVREGFTRMPNVSFVATAVHGEKSPEYYIPRDGHPSVRGNQVFAAMVAEKLFAFPLFGGATPAP